MVTETQRIAQRDEPPPLDEGWWQAILTEDPSFSDKPQRGSEKLKASLSSVRSTTPESVDWELAKTLYHEDRVVDLQVTGYNKGGGIGQRNGLAGLCADLPPY